MYYQLEFRPYHFSLTKPLVTNHGSWEVRSGIILKLINPQEKIGYGEIAPIAWFGSETFAAALEFCQQLPAKITPEEIGNIPDRLPATQFGFGSARASLESRKIPPFLRGARGDRSLYSYLLPTGITALNSWQTPWQEGYRTFKWKIGVETPPVELEQLQQLVDLLPAGAKLRLDANGGLNLAQAKLWLTECDRLAPSQKIEFLEQPLPFADFRDLLTLADNYRTAIALDESVATVGQLQTCYAQGWQGIFVIKPSIAGYGDRLREFLYHYPLDAVFSSSLETAIGRNHALEIALELSNPNRAIGFGVSNGLDMNSETLIQQLWQGH
jgi:O-succinylbenzoate synthase